ncbi:putative transposase [Candidatus Methanoperedenaceae archaeon GB50]|nr:putative transposase [Candidatus Methanoperedenaceae archaeon GB50]
MSVPRKKNKEPDNIIEITHRYRAYLTALQEYKAESWLYTLCNLYNSAIKERRNAYRTEKKTITYSQQQNGLLLLKDSDPTLKKVHSQLLQNCLQRVDRAYQKFFEDLKRKKNGKHVKVGYPRLKKLSKYRSFTYPQVWMKQKGELKQVIKFRQDNNKFGTTVLPGFGEVRIRVHRPLDWKQAKTVILKREKSGKWYLCITLKKAVELQLQDNGKSTGIDLGLKKIVNTSDTNYQEHPKFIYKSEVRIKKAQKKLSRKEKGSANYEKQRIRLARLHEKVANQRRDFLHKLALWLVVNYSFIAFERLNIKGMVKNHHLAKAILDAGWATLITLTTYKSVMLRGNEVVRVDPRYTSQECSACHALVPKTLAERIHKCPYCGIELDRETNAARVIEQKAFSGKTTPFRSPRAGAVRSHACGDRASTHPYGNGQARSLKQESH